MTRAARPSGLAILVRPMLAEASLWRRLRFEAQGECREALFELYAGLARSIAHRHFRRRNAQRADRADFEQLAFEGLLHAIDRFDPVRGVPFGAFARRRIAGNIATGIGRMTEGGAQISHRRRLEQERLRSLISGEIVRPEKDAVKALAELAVGLALGVMLQEGRGGAGERADPSPSAYESLEWRELQSMLMREIGNLPSKEAQIVRHHYDNGLSFAQIASLLGLSAGRVSQLHRAALERLRKKIGGFG